MTMSEWLAWESTLFLAGMLCRDKPMDPQMDHHRPMLARLARNTTGR
jgi:hypothetical protein